MLHISGKGKAYVLRTREFQICLKLPELGRQGRREKRCRAVGEGVGSLGSKEPEPGGGGVPALSPAPQKPRSEVGHFPTPPAGVCCGAHGKRGARGQDSLCASSPGTQTFPLALSPSSASFTFSKLSCGAFRGEHAYLNGSSSSSFQLGFGPSAVVVWQIVR